MFIDQNFELIDIVAMDGDFIRDHVSFERF